jgi:ectoine hydroxylase-related dioxygenase (phytanoyl-CoA dioxygenase family)
MTPTITDAQHRQFQEDGFFVLENVFTKAEMDELTERIEAFQRRHEERMRAHGHAEGISRAGEISFTDHLAEQDPDIRAFCTRPEFVAITTQVLAPDIDLYWNQSVFKAPEGDKEFPWHQDSGYIPVDPIVYLTLWLALNDATPENGCISVIPGSHKRGIVPHRDSPIGKVCHDANDPDQGIMVPVRAGSMAVFSSLTFHKSGVNRSKGTRKAYVIQYAQTGLRHRDTGQTMTEIAVARGGRAAAG